jgi:hypothetical protein
MAECLEELRLDLRQRLAHVVFQGRTFHQLTKLSYREVLYRSNPGGQISFDAGVGRERNGIFH